MGANLEATTGGDYCRIFQFEYSSQYRLAQQAFEDAQVCLCLASSCQVGLKVPVSYHLVRPQLSHLGQLHFDEQEVVVSVDRRRFFGENCVDIRILLGICNNHGKPSENKQLR